MRSQLLKILALAIIQASSGLLLSGMMLNAIAGTYLARRLLSGVVPSSTTVRRNFVTTRLDNGTEITLEQKAAPQLTGLTALVAAARVARALGMGRLLVSEPKCKTKKCKRSRKNNKSSEEVDIPSGFPPIKDSEEYSQYIIRSKDDEPEELVDELLSDDDPFNFYFIMKDQQKRMERKNRKMRQMHQNEQNQAQEFPGAGIHMQESVNMQRVPVPTLRRGIFPFYVRYRKPVPERYHK